MHEHHQHENHHAPEQKTKSWRDWYPLYVVIVFIATSSLISLQITEYTVANAMSFTMGFFFLYFSLFKLLDIKGFAHGYQEYDIISKRFLFWSYLVPFVEFALGVAYCLLIDITWLHIFTLLFSVIVMVGVTDKLSNRKSINCACLGTVLKVPLTWVSVLEYSIMAAMAVFMLLAPASSHNSSVAHEVHNTATFQQYAILQGEAYDAAFLHEMVEHHQGALDMARLVSERSQRDELVTLAETMFVAQAEEIRLMENWQEEWGYQATEHEHGMHSDMQAMYDELSSVPDADFDRRFLELMIEHHQSAVDMSLVGPENAYHKELKDLTAAIVLSQSREIAQMHAWQHDWGYIKD